MSSDILLSEALDTPINSIDLESKKNLATIGAVTDVARESPGVSHIGTVYGRRIECDTASGAAFVEDHCHPPGKRRPEYRGIPDGTPGAASHPKWVQENELTINPTADFPGTTINRVLVLSPPSVSRMRFVLAVDTTGGVHQNPGYNVPFKSVNGTSWATEVESWRMECCSDTYHLDATALNNAGMLAGVKFRGNVAQYGSQGVLLAHQQPMDAFHRRFCSHKGYREFVATIDSHAKRLAAESLSEVTPALSVQVVSLGQLPLDLGDVLQRSPETSESWRSTEGAFFVHDYTEKTQRYISQYRQYTSTAAGATAPPGEFILCAFETFNPTTNLWSLTYFSSLEHGSQAFDIAPWYDMEWSLLCFNFGANTTTTGGTPPQTSLVHKKIVGVGCQAPFGAFSSSLQVPPPYVDDKAMRMVSVAMSGMKDMLPARANALPSLLSKALTYAPTVLGFLTKAFGSNDAPGTLATRELVTQLRALPMPGRTRKARRRQEDSVVAAAEGVPRATAHAQVAAANIAARAPRAATGVATRPRNPNAKPPTPPGRPRGMPRAEWAAQHAVRPTTRIGHIGFGY